MKKISRLSPRPFPVSPARARKSPFKTTTKPKGVNRIQGRKINRVYICFKFESDGIDSASKWKIRNKCQIQINIQPLSYTLYLL